MLKTPEGIASREGEATPHSSPLVPDIAQDITTIGSAARTSVAGALNDDDDPLEVCGSGWGSDRCM